MRRKATADRSGDDGSEVNPADAARTLALASLNAAPRTRAQLSELLLSRGIPPHVATACLDRFVELHLIDDAEYARTWVRSRHHVRHLPRRALRYELVRKGLEQRDIDAALELIDDEDERSAALALAVKKAAATRGLGQQVRRRRIMGMLMRKGFTADVAAKAMAEALEEEGLDIDWDE